MQPIRWKGRDVVPDMLIEAARAARRSGWLLPDDRRFLHQAALALAAGRPLPPPDLLRLDLVLAALWAAGWRADPPAAVDPDPAVAADPAEVAALHAEVGRLALMLAAASERLEACQQRVDRLQGGRPPEDDLPWQLETGG